MTTERAEDRSLLRQAGIFDMDSRGCLDTTSVKAWDVQPL